MRFCSFDIGSNTVHALVARTDHGAVEDLAYFVEMPELGAEVQRTGRIGEGKTAEAIAAAQRVMTQSHEVGYETVLASATAAVRKAADGAEFCVRAGAELGVPIRLLSKDREAELSFLGVASRHAAEGEWLMADLGGGSTELVLARGPEMLSGVSLDLGSGALAARHLSDPPDDAELGRLRADADSRLDEAPEARPERLVCTGGTASNLPLLLGEAGRDELTLDDLAAARQLLKSRPAHALASGKALPEARIRALRAGVEVLSLLIDRYGLERLHVSHAGLRQGMILAYLENPAAWWEEGFTNG